MSILLHFFRRLMPASTAINFAMEDGTTLFVMEDGTTQFVTET